METIIGVIWEPYEVLVVQQKFGLNKYTGHFNIQDIKRQSNWCLMFLN